MAAWCAAELVGLRHAATHCFGMVFGGLMCFDFATISSISPIMIAHHLTCLVGLTIAACVSPSVYPYFLCGVMWLEMGSGFCNVFWIDKHDGKPRPRRLTYGVTMTISNVCALYNSAMWSFSAAADGPDTWLGVFTFSVICILVYMRQQEAVVLVWGSGVPMASAAPKGAEPPPGEKDKSK